MEKRTEPYKRAEKERYPGDESLKMNLPGGMTCGDCYAFPHCEALYAHIAADEVCDFYPNRFVEKKR